MQIVDEVVSCFPPAPWHDILIFFLSTVWGAVDLRNSIPLEWGHNPMGYS